MAAGACAMAWPVAFLAAGLTTQALAQRHAPAVAQAPRPAYHMVVRTAERHDPPAVAHAPAWGSWADAPGAWSGAGPGDPPVATPVDAGRAWTHGTHAHRAPDPNLRVRTPSGEGGIPPYDWGADPRWNGVRTPDDRARHGWRAGWHGAAPGWGGVWGYGWGDDWPAYATGDGGDWASWPATGAVWIGYGQGRGGWRGGFGYEQGWHAGRGHGLFGFGHEGGGGRVIALPSLRGD